MVGWWRWWMRRGGVTKMRETTAMHCIVAMQKERKSGEGNYWFFVFVVVVVSSFSSSSLLSRRFSSNAFVSFSSCSMYSYRSNARVVYKWVAVAASKSIIYSSTIATMWINVRVCVYIYMRFKVRQRNEARQNYDGSPWQCIETYSISTLHVRPVECIYRWRRRRSFTQWNWKLNADIHSTHARTHTLTCTKASTIITHIYIFVVFLLWLVFVVFDGKDEASNNEK